MRRRYAGVSSQDTEKEIQINDSICTGRKRSGCWNFIMVDNKIKSIKKRVRLEGPFFRKRLVKRNGKRASSERNSKKMYKSGTTGGHTGSREN